VRYGNVIGSRGSVIPLFLNQKKTGELTITDKRMTRFWITLDQGVNFVIQSLSKMQGGEIFVPKIPSMNVLDIALSIAPNTPIKVTGIRPGEKLHECLITEDESRHTKEFENYFMIEPEHLFWKAKVKFVNGKPLPEGYSYNSHENSDWITDISSIWTQY
jgi:UDP-N-acetylglucosamine 4,6-dehydratase